MLYSATSRIKKIRTLVIVSIAAAAIFAGPAAVLAQSSDAASSRSLVNQERSQRGLGSLSDSSGLNSVAQAQAQRMADRDAIYHNPNLGADADAAGVHWTLIGENVGVGPDVQAVHNAFMASDGHRANVVHADYEAIGVGIAKAKDGSVFIAHVFAQVDGAGSAPAPAAPKPVTTSTVAPTVSTPAPAVTVAGNTQTPAPQPISTESSKPADPTSPNALVGGIVNG